jgi:hypothetical protein
MFLLRLLFIFEMLNSFRIEKGSFKPLLVKSPPEDGVTKATFGPNSSQFLLVSSWDKKVRV